MLCCALGLIHHSGYLKSDLWPTVWPCLVGCGSCLAI